MKHEQLLDLAAELGYNLAMAGAETYRIEDSIQRMLSAYKIESEVFAIPNCITISIRTADGRSATRMKRVGFHGNDLDSVEKYNNLSRRICQEKPSPEIAAQWLKETNESRVQYSLLLTLLGNIVGSAGFAVFFGGSLKDALCAGVCGIFLGLTNYFLEKFKTNQFFKTIAAAFIMAFAAYITGALGIADNTDAVVIGTLMVLVPGLIFTNAMRDIIFGDTNSGINRIVQVLLIAAAIALGTGSALNLSSLLWGAPSNPDVIAHNYLIQIIASFIGCIGFFILFNIHGPGGFLCALGGAITWAVFCLVDYFGGSELICYFVSTLIAASYSETMARIRKYPAISYLVISIFPLIPGAGIYYTTNYLVLGDMTNFAIKGTATIAIAGSIAVGILMISTLVRLWSVWKQRKA